MDSANGRGRTLDISRRDNFNTAVGNDRIGDALADRDYRKALEDSSGNEAVRIFSENVANGLAAEISENRESGARRATGLIQSNQFAMQERLTSLPEPTFGRADRIIDRLLFPDVSDKDLPLDAR